jgi:AcrR family transcriptional regulator
MWSKEAALMRDGATNLDERRERKLARTRADILFAAARAMLRAGYAGATMQDIAREAGYTAASLYTYFRSKQEILEGLLALHTQEFERLFNEALPESLTFGQKVEMLLRRQLELIESQREIFQLFLSIGPAGPLVCREKDPFELRVARVVDWLRTNATRADLGGHAPEDVARFMAGVVFSLMHRWIASGGRESLSEQVPTLMDFFLYGVAGRGAGGPAKRRRSER